MLQLVIMESLWQYLKLLIYLQNLMRAAAHTQQLSSSSPQQQSKISYHKQQYILVSLDTD